MGHTTQRRRRRLNVLLIDADSRIPNLALMKLSAYHRSIGDSVDIVMLNAPYRSDRKRYGYIPPFGYDKVYCSIIFKSNANCVICDGVDIGGTGYDINVKLPQHVEAMRPDYSIYPDCDRSYGFITRGCIRRCSFCVVPEKEGRIHKVAEVSDIIQHKKVEFLDNNILAYENHEDVLNELIDIGIKCRFTQGLDIRLLTKSNSDLLSRLNYMGDYTFAFDSADYIGAVERGVALLKWASPWTIKFFVYVHPDMSDSDVVFRLDWLKAHKCLPYVMRDEACYASESNGFYADVAAYANQPAFFRKIDFRDYMPIRWPGNSKRVKEMADKWDHARAQSIHYTEEKKKIEHTN